MQSIFCDQVEELKKTNKNLTEQGTALYKKYTALKEEKAVLTGTCAHVTARLSTVRPDANLVALGAPCRATHGRGGAGGEGRAAR